MPDSPVFPPAHVLATLLRRVWLEDLLVKFWKGISSAFSSISIATKEASILSEMEKRVSHLKKANGLWRAERSESISHRRVSSGRAALGGFAIGGRRNVGGVRIR